MLKFIRVGKNNIQSFHIRNKIGFWSIFQDTYLLPEFLKSDKSLLNKALDYLTKYTYYKVLTTTWISPIVDNGVHYSLVIEEKKKK